MTKKISQKSKNPKKQRKYLALAPLHKKHKMLSSHLSKELKEKYKKRSFPLHKGDTVKIMVGAFKGKQGKILIINTKKLTVHIEGMQKTRKDGTKVNIPFNASNLQIVNLNTEDRIRIKALERRGKQNAS